MQKEDFAQMTNLYALYVTRYNNGWIYNLDERYIYLCNSCKEQAKPRKIINKLVLYSAFESGKKR